MSERSKSLDTSRDLRNNIEHMCEGLCVQPHPTHDRHGALRFLIRLVQAADLHKKQRNASNAFVDPPGSTKDIIVRRTTGGISQVNAAWFAHQVAKDTVRQRIGEVLQSMLNDLPLPDDRLKRRKPAAGSPTLSAPGKINDTLRNIVPRSRKRRKRPGSERAPRKPANYEACKEAIVDCLQLQAEGKATFKDILPFVHEALSVGSVPHVPQDVGATLQRMVEEKIVTVTDIEPGRWEYVLAEKRSAQP